MTLGSFLIKFWSARVVVVGEVGNLRYGSEVR